MKTPACAFPSLRVYALSGVILALGAGLVFELCWRTNSTSLPATVVASQRELTPVAEPRAMAELKITRAADVLELSTRCDAVLLESDEVQRVTDLRVALVAWSHRDPSAALRWILNSAGPLRGVALSALANALADDPATALAFGETVFRDQPFLAEEFGSMLIGELLRGGHFDVALELTATHPGPSNTGWMTRVLAEWAAKDPDVALDAERALSAQGVGAEIFAAIAQGWAQSAPAQLADFALTLPRGIEREVALRYGIEQWTLRDPATVAARVGSLTDSTDRDVAVSSYLAHTDTLNRPTSTALALALTVSNEELRMDVLKSVVREWADINPAGALAYVETAPVLAPGEREQLLHEFSSRPAD